MMDIEKLENCPSCQKDLGQGEYDGQYCRSCETTMGFADQTKITHDKNEAFEAIAYIRYFLKILGEQGRASSPEIEIQQSFVNQIERALTHAPALDAVKGAEWMPIERYFEDHKYKHQKILVTNNPYSKNARGHMSHVWCVDMVHKNPKGNHGIEGNYYALGGPYSLTHFQPIVPPAASSDKRGV